MHLDIYTVGQEFPHPEYKGVRDGAVVLLRETTFNVAIFIDKPHPKELDAFSSGPIEYGLFSRERVPFFLLDFKYMNFAPSFNMMAMPQQELQQFVNSKDNAMALFLVESNSYRMEAMRAIGLHPEFMTELRNTMTRQRDTYQNISSVQQKIRQS